MNQGLKSYTKQFTHNVSGVGTLSFNMCGAARNMHMIIPLISTVGHCPINLSLIYNEQEKEVNSRFGKGFRLSTYKTISSTDDGYEVLNADGSTDSYTFTPDLSTTVYSHNKETGLTLTYEADSNNVYNYYLRDAKGNEMVLDSSKKYPLSIKNSNEEVINFNEGSEIIGIYNSYNDCIYFYDIEDTVVVSYEHDGSYVFETVLSFTDSKLTKIQYYEYSEDENDDLQATLVGETQIFYDSNGYRLRNNKEKNITRIYYPSSSVCKIYDGFMHEATDSYDPTADYTITYNTLNTNTYNKTTLQDKYNNLNEYHFDSRNLLNLVEDQQGRVKFYSYEGETKNLKAVNNVFIKEEDNYATDLSFVMPVSNPGLGGSIGIVGPVEGELGTQNTVSEIWDKLTYYKDAGTNTQTISVFGDVGDTITFAFFLSAYAQASTGAVEFCLTVGGESKLVRFSNEVSGVLEMHSISVVAKEKFDSAQVTFTLPSGSKVRVGAYTLLKNKTITEYSYDGKLVESITNGNNEANIEYDSNGNPIKITVKEKTFLETLFNCNDIVEMTDKYGVKTELEYDSTYPRNVEKITTFNKTKNVYIEQQKDYTSNGKFVEYKYDEVGNRARYYYDNSGKIIHVLDASNNILDAKYQDGLLQELTLNKDSTNDTFEAQNKYYYDDRNRLIKVEDPKSINYEFIYNYKNQIEQIKMNGIVVMIYNEYLENVIRHQYGTEGNYYDFVYDSKGRIQQVYFNQSIRYTYEFDEYDKLVSICDEQSGDTKTFEYNDKNELIKISVNSFSVEIDLDNESKVKGKNHKLENKMVYNSFDSLEKSEEINLETINNVKDIGFIGTNLESSGKEIFANFEIFPFHSSLNSLKGVKPKDTKEISESPFVYDSLTKRYCLSLDGQSLSYDFGNSSAGTLIMRVKNLNSFEDKTLFEMKDTNGQTIEVRCSDGSHVDVYYNGEVVPYIYDYIGQDEWHTVGLSYSEGENASSEDTTHTKTFRLYVDGVPHVFSVESDTRFTSMITTLGKKQGYNSYFGGNIEMMFYKNAYCELETINSLVDSFEYISKRTYIDEFKRVSKKEVIKDSSTLLKQEYKYKTVSSDLYTARTSYEIEKKQ